MNKDKKVAVLIASEVNKLGGNVYYVGGFVRDNILGCENKDIDIEVYGITPDKLKDICSKIGKIDEVGTSFGVLKIHGYNLDITMPRTERTTGSGHKDFSVAVNPFMTTEEAAIRRDFTINALMQNVLTGQLIDHFDGRKDIEKGVIRHVDTATFIEDPLRVFRAAGFASRLKFKVSEDTLNLCKDIDVSGLSKERIFEETNKALLKAEKPSLYFEQLHLMEKLDDFFPELNKLHGVSQNPVYHPEGDVWTHTMMVIDNAANLKKCVSSPLGFMYSALFHDIGKIETTIFNKEKKIFQSIGHEKTGSEKAKQELSRLTNNKELTKYVKSMVEYHMMPSSIDMKSSYKTTNRILDKTKYPKDLILLSFCDKRGRMDINTELIKWWSERINYYEKLMKEPEVNGNDLLSLGYQGGPIFTKILSKCHDIHLAGVSKDDILRQVPSIVLGIKLHEKKEHITYRMGGDEI